MIEDELKSLRCAIEELGGNYISATEKFAAAVNHLSELMETPAAQRSATTMVEKHGTDDADREPEPKKEPKPEPKGDPDLTHAKVKALLVDCIAKQGMREVSSWMVEVIGEGNHIEDLPDGDNKLKEMKSRAERFLADKN